MLSRITIALWSFSGPLSLFRNGGCHTDMERARKDFGLIKSIPHPPGTRMQISLSSILGIGGHMRKPLLGKLLLAGSDSIKMFMSCVLHSSVLYYSIVKCATGKIIIKKVTKYTVS